MEPISNPAAGRKNIKLETESKNLLVLNKEHRPCFLPLEFSCQLNQDFLVFER